MISGNRAKNAGLRPDPAAGRRAHKELVQALERVRSRLAIATAADAKATPRNRWAAYLETEERIRRCLKGLRSSRFVEGRLPAFEEMRLTEQLLAPLRREVQRGEAHELHQWLQELLLLLEQTAPDPIRAVSAEARGGNLSPPASDAGQPASRPSPSPRNLRCRNGRQL